MSLGLAMVVKDESQQIRRCLAHSYPLFDEIVAVDTGSSDDTPDILSGEFGARVLRLPPDPADPHSITRARNLALAQTSADWILILDADEQLSTADVERVRSVTSRPESSAYFLKWRNTRNGYAFDDYKLALFRNGLGVKYEGLVHPNPQRSVRALKMTARMLDGVTIMHSLDKLSQHRAGRKVRLERYVREDPACWRYQWFLGYTYFKEGDFDRAVPLLRDTCNSLSLEYPVECLNAHMVLTDINARKKIHDKCYRILKQAVTFYESVRDDFEVAVNRDLGPWIYRARELTDRHELEEVRAYEFA